MSTLDELLRLGLHCDAEVLAGTSRLWREVTWVVRLRTRPPAIPPLAGGELVLVSIEALQALDARPCLARIVDQLVAEGAVTRTTARDDRRASIVRLTASGRRAFDEMAAAHEAWIVALFAGLRDTERAQLFALLAKLKRHVNATERDGSA